MYTALNNAWQWQWLIAVCCSADSDLAVKGPGPPQHVMLTLSCTQPVSCIALCSGVEGCATASVVGARLLCLIPGNKAHSERALV